MKTIQQIEFVEQLKDTTDGNNADGTQSMCLNGFTKKNIKEILRKSWCGGTFNPTHSYFESTMFSNEIETNGMNGSQLAEQGPSAGRCSRQRNIGYQHAKPDISKRRKWTSQENKIVMECYLLSEPKITGYRKHMLSLWLQKGMFWVSEQRLVDQANTIRRNSWMTELEIEELERKVTGSDSVIVEEARSVEALPDQVGDVRNVLPEMEAEEQVDSLDKEEVATVMKLQK